MYIYIIHIYIHAYICRFLYCVSIWKSPYLIYLYPIYEVMNSKTVNYCFNSFVFII